MRTLWIPALVLGWVPAALTAGPATAEPSTEALRSAPGGVCRLEVVDELDDLLRTIKKEKDDTPPNLFVRIGRKKSKKAFLTLRKSIPFLKNPGLLMSAYGAFTYFRDTEQAADALGFLKKDALKHRKDRNQNAAVQALVAWGPGAVDELVAVLDSKVDDRLKYLAARPIVAELGQRGDAHSLGLLLTYGPTDPRGQQQVKVALGKVRGSEALAVYSDVLSDKRASAERKQLLLELLSGWDDPDAFLLVADRLTDPDPDIQVRSLEILGNSRDERWRDAVEKQLRSKDEAVQREAILAMGRLSGADPDWVTQLFAFTEDRSPVVRMGAAAALLELRTVQAIDLLHMLLADDDWRVRAEALQQVGNLRRPISLPVLFDRLDAESGRLGADVASVLRLMTGQDHGRASRRWRAWWKAEGATFELPPYAEAVKAEAERRDRREKNESKASFYGLEIVSDRVMFVIDQSGSMSAPAGKNRTRGAGTGPTRLDVAVQEFTKAIRALRDGIGFNLIFFETGVRSWKEELLDLDDEVRQEAEAHAREQAPAGGTNVYGALLRAYEDERVDTIYLLTDGAPSAGEVTDTAEIRRRILRLNRTRKIVIHCISIGQTSAFLRELARENGGSYTESL